MKTIFLFFFLTFFQVVPIFSQTPFIKQYGGANVNDYGIGWDVVASYDGSYVVFANYQENGMNPVIEIIKINSLGNMVWGKKITPSWGFHIEASGGMIQTSDSGFMLTGKVYDLGYSNIYYLKLNKFGNVEWGKYMGTPMVDNYGEKVIETNDGGFLVVCSYFNQQVPNTGTYLIKTDFLGNTLWAKSYEGGQWSGYLNIEQNPNGTYTMIGKDDGISFVNVAQNGNILGVHRILLPMEVTSVISQRTSDGGHIIAGQIDSSQFATNVDFFLMKVNSTDSVMWCKKFSSISWEMPFSLRSTSDSGFIFTVYNNGGGINASIIFKLDASGDTLWTKGFEDIALYAVMEDHSGNYVATGRIDGLQPVQSTIVKIDSSGSTTCPISGLQYQESSMFCQYLFPGLNSSNYSFNTFNVPLTVSNFSNQSDYCLPASIPEKREEIENVSGRFYENVLELIYESFNDLQLQILLYDINGRSIGSKEAFCKKGFNKYTIETTLAPGIYFVKILSNKKEISIKVVKTI